VLKEIEDSQANHPVYRRIAHARRAGASEGAIDASNMLKPGLPRRAARHRSDHAQRISQVHRKDAASNAAFRSFLWASRMSKTRLRFCAASRKSTKSITASASRLGIVAGHSVASLHFRPLSARQGHRPDRRSCIVAAYSDRFHATEIDSSSAAPRNWKSKSRPSKKKKTRIRRNASLMSKKSSPESASNRTLSKQVEAGKRRNRKSRALKEKLEQLKVEEAAEERKEIWSAWRRSAMG